MGCCLTSTIVTFVVIVLILVIILLCLSFRKLEANEMGILFNVASRHFDREKVYEGGRHYVNVGNYFIKYPRTSQGLETHGIDARSSDGLNIVLSFSFNYRIQSDVNVLLRIYERYGETEELYVKMLQKMASNIVRDTCAKFEAFEYFNDRAKITAAISEALSIDINPLGFTVESFQLLNLAMPESFNKAIEETQIAQQEIEKVAYEKDAATLEASTRIAEAVSACQKIELDANARAEAITVEKEKAGQALAEALSKEAESYKELMTSLSLTNEELVAWVWLNAVSNSPAKKTSVIAQPQTVVFSKSDT